MKITFIVLGVVLLVTAWFVTSSMQLDETIISARYEMIACEDCNHMIVEKARNQSLIGKTIIPESSVVDIDQLIDSVALTKEPLCLRGKPYRFNWNFLGIKPDGIRFDINEVLDRDFCNKNLG